MHSAVEVALETHSVDDLTREIFGNVSRLSVLLFYCASLVAITVFAWGIHRRARLWRRGKPGPEPIRWTSAVVNLLHFVLLQKRVRGRGLASTAHGLLFGGFLVLFVGTLLIAVEHLLATSLGRQADDPLFHKGLYYAVYEVVLDTAGLALLAGCLLFAIQRLMRRAHPEQGAGSGLILLLLATIAISGYVTEGLRLVHEQTVGPGVSYVGYLAASLFDAFALTREAAAGWHAALWWWHAALSLSLIAIFPYSRLLHGLAGTIRLATGVDQLGSLTVVSLEQVEETGEIGAARIDQLTRRQLVELDACVSCARCEEACPAFEAGKPLSPLSLVQDIRRQLGTTARTEGIHGADGDPTSPPPSLCGDVISEETIWACTTCSTCTDVCPLGVNPLGFITELRRHLVGQGSMRGSPAVALQRMGRTGNPWGLPAKERLSWAAGLNVPTTAENPDFELLYWIGCAAAYDPRLQRVARSVVKLLSAAKISFAVLGPLERCTGEAARRMGDEFLFRQLAEENIATFERLGLLNGSKRIVSHCPHCVNSFRLDYPQLGARLAVMHHTELLSDLLQSGRLSVVERPADRVTYHDPCYLARVWNTTDAPRDILRAAVPAENMIEMARNGRQTACCGAGGGRMWFDDAPETRTGQSRITEALATGAETLAVSCPFCLLMTSDGVAGRGGKMAVRDVAEILADRVTDGEIHRGL